MTASSKAGEREDLARRLTLAVGLVNRRLRAGGEGLSVGLASALSTVMIHDGIRASDLAKFEKVAPPTMTRALADLESRGLVEREADPADGRASLIHATPAGVKAIEALRDDRAARLLALLDASDDIDVARLREAVHVIEGLLSVADSV